MKKKLFTIIVGILFYLSASLNIFASVIWEFEFTDLGGKVSGTFDSAGPSDLSSPGQFSPTTLLSVTTTSDPLSLDIIGSQQQAGGSFGWDGANVNLFFVGGAFQWFVGTAVGNDLLQLGAPVSIMSGLWTNMHSSPIIYVNPGTGPGALKIRPASSAQAVPDTGGSMSLLVFGLACIVALRNRLTK